MKAIGITCGIGSMLVGARDAGFDVVANLEWRKYYHRRDADGRNTFRENFPGAIFKHDLGELTPEERSMMDGADIALGHPECGKYSQLSAMNKDQSDDPSDIPLFVDLIAKFRPRFFVMDDLPKSFRAFPMREYAERLPDYDLFPEWISNYDYGNIQKNRRRMFMLGSLKQERWAFAPGEQEHALTMESILGDLLGREGQVPNHDPCALDERCQRAKHLETKGRGADVTYAELRDYFIQMKPGGTLGYHSPAGYVKRKPGHARAYWDGHAHVLDGASVQVHPMRCTPLTIRERARLQGFPDDFIFYGTRLNVRGEYNHEKNYELVKQTGKAMPIQFCRYVSRQVAAHIRGVPFESSGERILVPRPEINLAKEWYCENVGYADQRRACANCWLYKSCGIRARKYGIGDPPRGQPDLPLPAVPVPTTRSVLVAERKSGEPAGKIKARARRVASLRWSETTGYARITTKETA